MNFLVFWRAQCAFGAHQVCETTFVHIQTFLFDRFSRLFLVCSKNTLVKNGVYPPPSVFYRFVLARQFFFLFRYVLFFSFVTWCVSVVLGGLGYIFFALITWIIATIPLLLNVLFINITIFKSLTQKFPYLFIILQFFLYCLCSFINVYTQHNYDIYHKVLISCTIILEFLFFVLVFSIDAIPEELLSLTPRRIGFVCITGMFLYLYVYHSLYKEIKGGVTVPFVSTRLDFHSIVLSTITAIVIFAANNVYQLRNKHHKYIFYQNSGQRRVFRSNKTLT